MTPREDERQAPIRRGDHLVDAAKVEVPPRGTLDSHLATRQRCAPKFC